MPMYEYRCEECGLTFETLRRIADADKPADCPHCGGSDTRRQVTACAVSGGCGARTGSGFS